MAASCFRCGNCGRWTPLGSLLSTIPSLRSRWPLSLSPAHGFRAGRNGFCWRAPASFRWGWLYGCFCGGWKRFPGTRGAGLGIVQMGLPYVLFARGLKSIPGHEATGIGLAEPLLVPLWTYLAWGDEPAWWTLVGGGLILVGLAIRYASPKKSASSDM